MWLFLFLFLVQTNPTSPNGSQAPPAQTQSPSLIIQVVDPQWLPVAGANVTLKPLAGNAESRLSHAETDKNGYANFSVPRDANYAIEAESPGFRRQRVSSVHLSRLYGPAYVHLRLRLGRAPPTVAN